MAASLIACGSSPQPAALPRDLPRSAAKANAPAPTPASASRGPWRSFGPPAPAPPKGRLDDSVQPLRYRLHVNVDPGKPKFSGTVEIDVRVRRAVSQVWLHGKDLAITRAEVRVPRWGLWTPVMTTQRLRPLKAMGARGLIGFYGPVLPPGNATLVFEWSGRFGERTGLFRQRFRNRWYSLTDFEPKDARAAFPCFDDPRFKVPWTIAVSAPTGMLAFANTAETKRVVAAHTTRFEFAPTPPLPSYLVAFAAGPFEVVPVSGNTSVPVRIIALRNTSARVEHAAKLLPPLLAATERYFGMRSPYKKIDLIAVPYFSGAMENPGLITVGAHILLLPDKPSADQRKLLAIVIAHELAHLWFGDLVTMSYWDDLWLNEGFATWMADKLVAAHVPELDTRAEEVQNKAEAMLLDRNISRPVRPALSGRQRTRAHFDELTYKKAGALVSMIEASVGAKPFRSALSAYVRAHAHKVVVARDLYQMLRAVGAAAGARQLATLVDQPGIPLVRATVSCKRGSVSLALEQTRYQRATVAAPKPVAVPGRWDLPICVRYGRGTHSQTRCVRLRQPRQSYALDTKTCPAWLHPNAGGNGYYYYELAPRQLRALASSPALDHRERADLALSIDALLRAGHLEVASAVDAMIALARHGDRFAVTQITRTLRSLAEMLDTPRQRRRFRQVARQMIGPLARKLGIAPRPKEPYSASELRSELLAVAALYAHEPQLIARARKRSKRWLDRGTGIDAPALAATLRFAAMSNDAALYDRMASSLSKTKALPARIALAKALGSFARPALIKRSLDLAMRGDVRQLELTEMLTAQLARPETRAVAFERAALLLGTLRDRLYVSLRAYLPFAFRHLCSANDRTRFDQLFAGDGGLSGEAKRQYVNARSRARRLITECIDLRHTQRASAQRYFR